MCPVETSIGHKLSLICVGLICCTQGKFSSFLYYKNLDCPFLQLHLFPYLILFYLVPRACINGMKHSCMHGHELFTFYITLSHFQE